jgi:hypothetical protein
LIWHKIEHFSKVSSLFIGQDNLAEEKVWGVENMKTPGSDPHIWRNVLSKQFPSERLAPDDRMKENVNAIKVPFQQRYPYLWPLPCP